MIVGIKTGQFGVDLNIGTACAYESGHSEGQLSDIISLLRFLQQQSSRLWVSPDGARGHSYGGELVVLQSIHFASMILMGLRRSRGEVFFRGFFSWIDTVRRID